MAKKSDKEALEKWKLHCENVQSKTYVDYSEIPAERGRRVSRLLDNYSDFVDYYFPHYTTNPDTGVKTACAKFHIDAAPQGMKNHNLKAVFKWGARTRQVYPTWIVFIPLWLKAQKIKATPCNGSCR